MARNAVDTSLGASAVDNGRIGPFSDSNGNIYCVLETSSTTVDVYKTSNPSGGSWTQQDTANNPSGLSSVERISARIVGGNTIHIALKTDDQIRYYTFHTSANASNPDTWQINELAEDPTNNSTTFFNCDISVRSNGHVVIMYDGDLDKIMGTDYHRVDYAKRTGTATWSAGNALDGAGEANWHPIAQVLGASDNVWFQYMNASTQILYHEKINSSDTQSNFAALQSSTIGVASWPEEHSSMVYYDDSGTEVFYEAWGQTGGALMSNRARNGTLQGTQTVHPTPAASPYGQLIGDGGTTIWAVLAKDPGAGNDQIISRDNVAEGGWNTTDNVIHTLGGAGTILHIHAEIINYGGAKYIGVIYYDPVSTAGIYYTEYQLAAAPAAVAHNLLLMGVGQ